MSIRLDSISATKAQVTIAIDNGTAEPPTWLDGTGGASGAGVAGTGGARADAGSTGGADAGLVDASLADRSDARASGGNSGCRCAMGEARPPSALAPAAGVLPALLFVAAALARRPRSHARSLPGRAARSS